MIKNLFKKIFPPVVHINYSDWSIDSEGYHYCIGTIRDRASQILGQFYYYALNFGAVVYKYNDFVDKVYFIAKPTRDEQYADAYIHPHFGGMYNVHSFKDYLKLEFGL